MSIPLLFSDLKDLIELSTHLQRDALHVHIGLVLFLGLAAVLPPPRRFRKALCWVLLLCIVGEVFDLSIQVATAHPLNWLGSAKDIVNTMLWPTILVFAGPAVARLLGLSVSIHRAGAPQERSIP